MAAGGAVVLIHLFHKQGYLQQGVMVMVVVLWWCWWWKGMCVCGSGGGYHKGCEKQECPGAWCKCAVFPPSWSAVMLSVASHCRKHTTADRRPACRASYVRGRHS